MAVGHGGPVALQSHVTSDGTRMSEARKIADSRLAKGEITPDEHARITNALVSESPPAPPEGAKGAKPDNTISPHLAWFGLMGSVVIALGVRMAVANEMRAGYSINWTLVYIVYAVCAAGFVFAVLSLLGNQKK